MQAAFEGLATASVINDFIQRNLWMLILFPGKQCDGLNQVVPVNRL